MNEIPQEIQDLFSPEDLAELTGGLTQQPEKPLCPKCNAEMVLRTAKKGPFTGKQFYGCTMFPQCNGTQNIVGGKIVPNAGPPPIPQNWCALCGFRTDASKSIVIHTPSTIHQSHCICNNCATLISIAQTDPPNLIEFVLG